MVLVRTHKSQLGVDFSCATRTCHPPQLCTRSTKTRHPSCDGPRHPDPGGGGATAGRATLQVRLHAPWQGPLAPTHSTASGASQCRTWCTYPAGACLAACMPSGLLPRPQAEVHPCFSPACRCCLQLPQRWLEPPTPGGNPQAASGSECRSATYTTSDPPTSRGCAGRLHMQQAARSAP